MTAPDDAARRAEVEREIAGLREIADADEAQAENEFFGPAMALILRAALTRHKADALERTLTPGAPR
jgi:hypothetical protein